jgi:hypothetical protein
MQQVRAAHKQVGAEGEVFARDFSLIEASKWMREGAYASM